MTSEAVGMMMGMERPENAVTVSAEQAQQMLYANGFTDRFGVVLSRHERRKRGQRAPLPKGWHGGQDVLKTDA